MIESILNRKIRFTPNEDTLTSSIFDHLKLLPENIMLEIIINSCYDFPKDLIPTNLISLEYWPHWDAKGSNNKNYVEPDLFLEFSNIDVIIEAKRWDDNQQYTSQWKNELQGYLNEYENKEKKVFLIALGGVNNIDSEKVTIKEKEFKIIKSRWSRILNEVKKVQKSLSLNKGKLETIDRVLSLLEIIILYFEFHGFYVGEWLQSIPFHNYKISAAATENKIFNLKF